MRKKELFLELIDKIQHLDVILFTNQFAYKIIVISYSSVGKYRYLWSVD